MIHTSLKQIEGTEREVEGDGWRSRRLLLARDGLPYSVHDTLVGAGTELRLRYARHRETVYCLEGRGTLVDVAADESITVEPGVLYSIGTGRDYVLTLDRDSRFLCVFDPPLEGTEEAS